MTAVRNPRSYARAAREGGLTVDIAGIADELFDLD